MKNFLNIKDNLKFAKISGDFNKIHIDKNYAKKFFFKYCVTHGVNIVALCLSKFLKQNYKNNFLIYNLDINFLNYIEIDEKFEIKILGNRIVVKNDINLKLEIKIKYNKLNKKIKLNKKVFFKDKKYYFKNLYNQSLIRQLLELTKNIGSSEFGDGSLILKINIEKYKNIKKTRSIDRINKNAFKYYLRSKNYKVECLVVKIKPFINEKITIKKNKKIDKLLKGKSVLIFGSNGVLGSFTKNYLFKYHVNLHLVTRTKQKTNNLDNIRYFRDTNDLNNLKKTLNNSYPDYIFYFISPKILKTQNLGINKRLYNLYKFYYVTLFEKILKLIKNYNKKVFIFYPSTVALDKKFNNYKFSNEYKLTKQLGEKLCKKKKTKKIFPISFRIEQIKSPQNYNIAGFYEGCSPRILKSYIDSFILKSKS